VSDHSRDNDVSWDVARGSSSLIVSSLAVASNGTASDVAWLGMSYAVLRMSAWSSRASKLALSLDDPATYCQYTSRYLYWCSGCFGSLKSSYESSELCHLWMEKSLGERARELMLVGVCTYVLT
jgi:hypothetical protein